MYNYYQLVCTLVALLWNFLLLYLICTKSPKKMGNYKYLMIYTSVFEIFFATLDYFVEAKVFTHGFAVMFFRDNSPEPCGSQLVSRILVNVYCVSFGMIMGLLGSHFVYRFGVTDAHFQHRYTSGWKYYLLFVMPVVFGMWWAGIVCFFCGQYNEYDDYMRPHILDALDLKIENVCYLGFKYYMNDISSGLKPNWTAWFALANCSTILTISVFCVMYFGVCCYQKITIQLAASSNALVSKYSVNLQKQLFNALVAQTVIPALVLYVPAGAFFFLPMMNVGFGYSSRLITDVIALYPVVDPLPNMFIIQSYRRAIIDAVGCCRKSTRAAQQTLSSVPISTI